MRPLLAIATILTLLLAGCVQAPADESADAPVDAASAALPEPVTTEFQGHMTASLLAPVAHRDPRSEMLFADVQREGFVYEILAQPQSLRVELEWSGAGNDPKMVAMITVPLAEGGAWDYFTEPFGPGVACLVIPGADLPPGKIGVMAHSRNAVDVDYTFRMTILGGEGVLHADAGHMEVERADAEEREHLPCEETAADEDAGEARSDA